MKRRPTILADLAESATPRSGSPDLPAAGWLAAELAARDEATTDALLASVRTRTATGGNGTRLDREGWLAAELRRRDDSTAAVLREAIEERCARIDDIARR